MGQLLRILIVLLGLWLVLLFIRRALSRRHPTPNERPKMTKMVSCAHCGVHIPETEAVRDGARYFCSREHLENARN